MPKKETNNFEELKSLDPVQLARRLLGSFVIRYFGNSALIGKIVETEAYWGKSDPASHAYKKKTLRNSVMFGPPLHLYVYFTYGMHYCANVVCLEEGEAGAVLIRAVEPILDLEQRGHAIKPVAPSNKDYLTNGPAKFCKTFGICREHNGLDLTSPLSEIHLKIARPVNVDNIVQTTRIGIKKAVNFPWRFYISDSEFVSKKITR